jgi:hypothetical protein
MSEGTLALANENYLFDEQDSTTCIRWRFSLNRLAVMFSFIYIQITATRMSYFHGGTTNVRSDEARSCFSYAVFFSLSVYKCLEVLVEFESTIPIMPMMI